MRESPREQTSQSGSVIACVDPGARPAELAMTARYAASLCLGVRGLRKGEGVRTVGRLHPGQAWERLLKQRPVPVRDCAGLYYFNDAGCDSECESGVLLAVALCCVSLLERNSSGDMGSTSDGNSTVSHCGEFEGVPGDSSCSAAPRDRP